MGNFNSNSNPKSFSILLSSSSSKPSVAMSSSSTTTSIFYALSMADSRLHSFSSSRSLSIPSRPIKLHSLSLFNKTHFTSIVARAEEDATVALQQEQEVVVDGSSEGGGGEGSFEDSQGNSVPEPSEDAKLFVANIPYDVDGERLAALFEEVGVVEIAEVIYSRDTDRSRGFGFVTMANVEDAEKAVEKFSGYELDGRPLVVNKAGARGERIERPPRTFSPGFRIYVGNLPWDVDNSRLEQIFSEHGKVSEARVVLDRETGRARGFGFVLMADENGMNDAIAALDGQNIDGRTIRVSVAQERTRRF